jgi:ligand-binding sensor domain-containing protein/signal transduction histidine kinase/DNA-binding NarL/FixJ family response regulator
MKGFIIFLMLIGFSVYGQVPSGKTMHYTQKDGLSFNIINSIAQDNQGFIWFATGNGLNRFDGINFRTFKSDLQDSSGIPGNYIQKIFKDHKGTFWISSRKGLYSFDLKTEKFRRQAVVAGTKPDDITWISENAQGKFWIGTTGNGFSAVDPSTGHFVNYNRKNLKGLPSNDILCVEEDSAGKLWLGTQDEGLCVFKIYDRKPAERVTIKNKGLANSRVNRIYQDHLKNTWIATSNGLWFYSYRTDTFHQIDASRYHLRSNVFLSLIEDKRHQLYIGLQDGGLYHMDMDKYSTADPSAFVFDQVENENGYNITSRSVEELFLDRDENLWLGTYGDGLFMLSRNAAKFQQFRKTMTDNSGESDVRFYGMCVDTQGYLWLGTDGDGIYKTRRDGTVIKHYRATGAAGSLTDNAILSAYKDSRGNLWFGTYARGLLLYHPETDGFTSFKHDPSNPGSLPCNDVRVIREDRNHNIWVGTNGGGLARLDPAQQKFTSYTSANSGLTSNDVRAIEADERGNLWLGTYGGGLNYFVAAQNQIHPWLQHEKDRISLAGKIIYALHLDQQKRLWIGSEGEGLLVYYTDKNTVRRLNEKDGMADNTVYAILEESPGKLWVSTNDGISKIDFGRHKVYNFNSNDGLQGKQFNAGSAIVADKGNLMIFGGTEGWNLFHPKEIRPSKYKPQIRITGLQLYGREENDKGDLKHISRYHEITLQSNQSVFSIQYVALNFVYPRDAQYAYKMEGLDNDWNYVKSQRSATYRYLQPGRYTFKVKTTNEDDVWQDDYASVDILVLPPWYKSWWAYTTYAAVAVLITYLLIHYKAKQTQLRYRIRIASLEAQQERELYENRISFFTNISHEFRSPLTLIVNPVREMISEQAAEGILENLTIVYRNAKRLLSLVDQLLLFGKADTSADRLTITRINLISLCEEVFLCFTYLAAKKDITYLFTEDYADAEVYGDREKIEIALFNLISNALRHTPEGGKVTVAISEDQTDVILRVIDTGTGIPAEIGDKVFDRFYKVPGQNSPRSGFGIGLFLVKNFVESHFGKVSFVSVQGKGTSFEIRLLKGKAQFVAYQIHDDQSQSSMMLDELNGFNEEIDTETELSAGIMAEADRQKITEGLSSEKLTLLIIDDNEEIRHYIEKIFRDRFELLSAPNGEEGLQLINRYLPDMIICDVLMQNLNGIELCRLVKADPALNHIPLVLLTASTSSEIRLRGIECGADDYISKPFEKDLLVARVEGLLKSRNNLQTYFYNKITLKSANMKISAEYKDFLDHCIEIVERHMTDPDFGISTLAEEIGMSRSNLYTKIKSISGQSANSFIRYIRLRKAAEIFINTDLTIQQTILKVGIRDNRYFREQFFKLFQMNPSDYIKKYRKTFSSRYTVNKSLLATKQHK